MHVYYIHFKGFRVSFIGGIFCSLLVYNNTKSLSILCHPTEQLSKISPIGAWRVKSKKVIIYDNRSRWIEARESGGQVTDGSNWMQLIAVSTLVAHYCTLPPNRNAHIANTTPIAGVHHRGERIVF